MSSSNKSILRNNKVPDVENLQLPTWDKHGNEIHKAVTPQAKPTQVEDVSEESLKVPTLKEVESIREEAYNEGFEQGFQNGLGQGHREGVVEGKKEGYEVGYQEGLTAGMTTGHEQTVAEERVKTDDKLTVLASVANELKNQLGQEQSELEKALLVLSIKIARQVLQDELHLDPNHIAVVVHAAVQSLPNPDEKLTVLLNSSDLEFVSSFADSHWTLEADESISAGGCKIKSKYSYVDYTLEHRFDNAVSQLVAQLEDSDINNIKQPITDEYLLPLKQADIQERASTNEESTDANLDASPDSVRNTVSQADDEIDVTNKASSEQPESYRHEPDGEVEDTVEDNEHADTVTETETETETETDATLLNTSDVDDVNTENSVPEVETQVGEDEYTTDQSRETEGKINSEGDTADNFNTTVDELVKEDVQKIEPTQEDNHEDPTPEEKLNPLVSDVDDSVPEERNHDADATR